MVVTNVADVNAGEGMVAASEIVGVAAGEVAGEVAATQRTHASHPLRSPGEAAFDRACSSRAYKTLACSRRSSPR